MPTYYGAGTHRLIYKAVSFTTGLTVTGYIWNAALTKSALQTFTEVSDGLYYLDYNFAATGTYFGKFYEGGSATVSGSFIVESSLSDILSLLDDARSEPGDGVPPVNPDAMTKIDYLYKFLRNKVETTDTRIHIYDDGGTNKDQSSVISDDGTTFTRGEFGAGD